MFSQVVKAALLTAGLVAGQGIADPELTGTWSSKSNSVFTGPGFYDPVKENLIEPQHTGISYSFTNDGFYEVAYYRAIANPVDPSCPQGIMQWQHGKFEKLPNGSLTLDPFEVDGRQLLSDPCHQDHAVLTRFIQPQLFKSYYTENDDYHQIQRLNLFEFDGAPLMPLYLANKSPQMLPTSTLNPTNTPTGGAKATSGSKMKRSLGGAHMNLQQPLNHNVVRKRKSTDNLDFWWWVGVGMTGVGGVLFFCV
jgi:hypothetical protein